MTQRRCILTVLVWDDHEAADLSEVNEGMAVEDGADPELDLFY
jgi:hypothetical protein